MSNHMLLLFIAALVCGVATDTMPTNDWLDRLARVIVTLYGLGFAVAFGLDVGRALA